MSYYSEKLGNRILELLSQPVIERCPELGLLFDRCSVREMQELFPIIVNSIFDIPSAGIGWGLRCTTKENSPHAFDILHDFFIPHGPMFRLCYRLLNDAIKFEFSMDLLPHKLGEMLQSGQYSMFYSDMLSVDPFRRCVTALSLNAFDYFILNFAIHGTFPLHKRVAAALQVHNERMKTIYFFLSAQYLCTFLPESPDQIVMPQNICVTVKAPQPMPVQPLQPTRSPKYLKIPNVSPYSAANNQAARTAESPRTYAWRTESVLHLFVDSWLRYDVEEARDLPSSEFIRVVRILVKQMHTFGNCAYLDTTPMASLRKMSQPMMKARIFPFLKSIIARWPLDSSLSVVLELWLSYIQPWRYTFEWQTYNHGNVEIPISSRFDSFIQDNLAIYTQIFIHILPRFERLDFTTFRNVIMLHRLVKVFSQTSLPQKLYNYEQAFCGNNTLGINHLNSTQISRNYRNRLDSSGGSGGEWDNLFDEDNYIPMFGPGIQYEIENFIKFVNIAKMYVQQEIQMIQSDKLEKRNNIGFFARTMKSLFEDVSTTELKLQEKVKIPDILDLAMQSLGIMFDVSIPEISMDQLLSKEQYNSHVNFSLYDNSEYLDISKISPMQMRNNIANIKTTIDPALLPIQSQECAILVRFLHQVSCKVNEMFSEEMQNIWNGSDIWGRLSRQVLSPPMTAQWFDKQRGVSQLCEDQLPPRICLRPLASYKNLIFIGASLIVGQLLWGAPSYGLLSLFLLTTIYLFILAFI
ncbi:sphingomyelin phosphodiesterase 4 [Eupeodes corollae]|uniref:sphingomyelin phosphodiesterase 4 n=1 Tax=Eupeodes corollae TaxID=290404 RepID=UPI0024907172|nr:sphingomyelin phosphodiesterase 4 [Eupeodes corollae]